MSDWWKRRALGRTGIAVSRLGRGSPRRDDFGAAITRCARRDRDNLCVVVQSYSRSALALGPSFEIALRRLRIDHARRSAHASACKSRAAR